MPNKRNAEASGSAGGRMQLAAAMAASLAVVATLLWTFHDRFWWAVDEGVYAYVAQRILAGDVPHRDLVDLHGGYVNYLHALAFQLFGEDLVSLRYPLALLTFIQSLLAGWLLAPGKRWAVAMAPLVVTAFSFVQFLNPSANWYSLFMLFLTCWALTRIDPRTLRGTILIGVLLGTCFLLRQLSGVLLAMGSVCWLLMSLDGAAGRAPWLARSLLLVIASGLAGYLWSKGSAFSFLLFGIGPLAFIALSCARVRADGQSAARLVFGLSAGVLLAAAPLALWYASEGSIAQWLEDILFTALLINRQEFIAEQSYLPFVVVALAGIRQMSDPVVFLNGFLWLSLLAAPPVLGVLVSWDLVRRGRTAPLHPLPVLSLFFALVAIHYEISMYLWFAISPVLLALLRYGSRFEIPSVALALLLSTTALLFQAGQPVSRGFLEMLRGDRFPLDAQEGLPRARLQMERADQELFRSVIARIEAEARPGEPLYTLPMDPELNFLTGRRSPVDYYGTPLGLRNPADVDDSMKRLREAAPLFVVHRREDKYSSRLSDSLLSEIRRLAPSPEPIGPFDLYRLPAPAKRPDPELRP
jgi:hypothetical protein